MPVTWRNTKLNCKFWAHASDAAGKAWWVEQIDTQGQDIVHVAEQFLHSAELTGQYLAPQQWDFLL